MMNASYEKQAPESELQAKFFLWRGPPAPIIIRFRFITNSINRANFANFARNCMKFL